ncbi:MAG: HDIG domain-containing protein [Bacteroidales bacterium]|nr:HDIG domain-containing protein [Bacteroidales bacterium]
MIKITLKTLRDRELLLKIALFAATVISLVLVLPKEGRFRYEFTKGKPWLHDDLYAPFDFAIIKYEDELKKEQEDVSANLKPFFNLDTAIYLNQKLLFEGDFDKKWAEKYGSLNDLRKQKENLLKVGLNVLDSVFEAGIIQLDPSIENKPADFEIFILEHNIAREVTLSKVFTLQQASQYITARITREVASNEDFLINILTNYISHNLFFNSDKTNAEMSSALDNISPFRGMVQRGELIIPRGARVNDDHFRILTSLKNNYEVQLGTTKAFYAIAGGQAILTSISILVLILFLYNYRKDILANNKKTFLILLLIFMMVFIASIVVRYEVSYFYLVPVCLVPVIIRVFYDTRLALFVHLITIFITGFIAPNSFQFVFIQLIAGVVAIMSIVRLERRSQFFYTAFWVLCTYIAIYIGLILLQEGSLSGININSIYQMAGNAAFILFAYPLIYLIERTFNYITDVTLIELGNSNNKLLRELSHKAPGTFQHSLQVANLAEEASYAIGGDSKLVRVGALYHDIGKMEAPMYFIENQISGVNPHDQLSYEESARIIIRHVTRGLELAKKHKLPIEISDFISTHHGTKRVEYFYIKQKLENPDKSLDEKSFTYPGPIPYSKETALVMMADAVEAASRSLKQPDDTSINELVERIITRQFESDQYANANLTFRDINQVKEIFKKNLQNIYHVRISYPEEKVDS